MVQGINMRHRNYSLINLLMAVCLLAVQHAYADFEFGIQYYENKKFDKAYEEFLAAAQFGDNDAQFNLGAMYYRGEHVTKDLPTAYAWMKLASQNANYKEQALHTKIHAKFNESDKSLAEAKYNELFALYGDATLADKLMPTLTGQTSNFQDYRAIKKVPPKYPMDMLRAGKSGVVDVLYTVDKDGSTKDHIVYPAGSRSFELAAIEAARHFIYEPLKINGKAVSVNGVKNRFTFEVSGSKYDKQKLNVTISELKDKATKGNASDKLIYGYFLEALPAMTGDFRPEENPNDWYLKAANQGSAAASYFLGRNILYGNMCTQDDVLSMGWLLKSARQGISDAQYMLAIESFSGARFEKNDEKGFYWLKKAAETNQIARVKYSWILATHPLSEKRNAKIAQEYIGEIDDEYYDKQSLYQTRAAVAAESDDFKNAIKWQKKALKDAKNYSLPTDVVMQRLDAYENKKPWREEP
jgi:TonB family protein